MNSIISAYRNHASLAVAGIFAVAVLLGGAVYTLASVSLDSATINGGASATVEPGETVTVDVSTTKSGSACENNFGFTRVTVTGPDSYNEVYESSLDSYIGTGVVVDSVDFPAPGTDGDYEVLVEIYRGVEEGLDCSDLTQLWGFETLDLTVETPVDPFIEVLSISPLDEVRIVGDINPVTYTAEIEVGGNPESAHLQCVVFDIFRGDNWNEVDVSGEGYDTPGIYEVSLDYDISTYATGTYDVVAIASEETCEDFTGGGFDTQDYRANGNTQYDAETTLIITELEPEEYTIDGYKFNDLNGNGEWDDEEPGIEGWTINLSDGEENVDSTETDSDGYYSFTVGDGTWVVSEQQEEGWTQTAPEAGDCEFSVGQEEEQQLEVLACNFGNQENNNEGEIPGCTDPEATNYDSEATQDDESCEYESHGGGGGGGGGEKIELTESHGGGSSPSEPLPEVLGEQISNVPVGAPNAGAGGAAPSSIPSAVALLTMLVSLAGIRVTRNG